MTTSILNDLLLLKNEPREKIQEYLQSINLQIFDPIFEKYIQNDQEAKQIVLYIVCAYSEDSPLIILRQDSKEEKEGICEYLQIPEYLRGNLVNFGDQIIRKAATQYLTKFAGPLFRSYMFMKIQAADYELDITDRAFTITKTEKIDGGEIVSEVFDSKEHGKAIAEYNRLCIQINKTELAIRAQVKRMEGIEEIKEFARTGKETGKLKGARVGNVENVIG